MDTFDAWPVPVTDHLRRAYGDPVSVERLGGMSGAAVHRLRFADGSVIVKAGSGRRNRRESLFYRYAGDPLLRAGVSLPRLLWSAELPDGSWLVLEDIPTPVPVVLHDRWQPDARMVAMLARLHALALDLPDELATYEEWDWAEEVTDAALTFFEPATARELAAPLRALREEAMHLGERWCWISGDPNPNNWGLRADGSPVLYDWELVRRGTPPIDLAILVTGLGDEAMYEQVAACYLDAWRATTNRPPWAGATLARDIALGKVWSVATFLRACVTNEGRIPERLRGQLAEYVPPWVQRLAR